MTELPGLDRLAPGAVKAWRRHLGEEVDAQVLIRNLSEGSLPHAFHEVAARHSGRTAFIIDAVVGAPSEQWGEEVVAFVVPEGGGVDAEALATHVREHLSAYKCPKRFIEIEELPRDEMGTVQRDELVRAAEEEARAGPS